MPREQINFPKIRTRYDDTLKREVHEPDHDICAHVGWNRSGWVQVSLSIPHDRMHLAIKEHDSAHPGGEAYDFFSEMLDRTEINRMINTLRKARDQAYGKDA